MLEKKVRPKIKRRNKVCGLTSLIYYNFYRAFGCVHQCMSLKRLQTGHFHQTETCTACNEKWKGQLSICQITCGIAAFNRRVLFKHFK